MVSEQWRHPGLFNQQKTSTRSNKVKDGNKSAYIENIVFLKFCVLAMTSLAKEMKSSQVNHAGLASHSCSNSNLLRIAWKLWMVLALPDEGKLAW